MDNSDKQQRVLNSFYRSLDQKTLDALSDEQKQAIAHADEERRSALAAARAAAKNK